MKLLESGIRATILGIIANSILAIIKILTGIVGASYALIADGIESTMDVITSIVVWGGLRMSANPPDENHPYGHGKAESIAGLFVSMALFAAALIIAVKSVKQIITPHNNPEWFTLVVLVFVILIKEILFRYIIRIGDSINSTALIGDAWHHRCDALTSAAALVGISIALVGGERFNSADGWAALFACTLIAYNGVSLFKTALNEIMDGTVPQKIIDDTRRIAGQIEEVIDIGECRIRKSGVHLLVDIHVQVDGNMNVVEGHDIAHRVRDELIKEELNIKDVIVHIEPYNKVFNTDMLDKKNFP